MENKAAKKENQLSLYKKPNKQMRQQKKPELAKPPSTYIEIK